MQELQAQGSRGDPPTKDIVFGWRSPVKRYVVRHRVGAGVFPWQRLGMQRARRSTGNSRRRRAPVITGGLHALRSEDLFGAWPLGVIATLPTLEEGVGCTGCHGRGAVESPCVGSWKATSCPRRFPCKWSARPCTLSPRCGLIRERLARLW